MSFFGVGDPIAIGVALQLLRDARANLLARLRIRSSDEWRDRCSGQMIEDETVQTRQVNIEPIDANLHVGKTSFCCETLQLVLGRNLSGSAKLRRCCIANESSERFADRGVVEPLTIPDAERNAAASSENAPYLAQRERLVREKLQALLAEHRIEARIRQLKIERVALEPLNGRTGTSWQRPSHRDHAGIQIDANHVAVGSHAFRRDARHYASSASKVQDAFPCRKVGGIDQQRGPRAKDAASDHLLVSFSRIAAEVPLLVLVHFGFQPSLREIRPAVCVTALICACDGEAGMY